VQIFNLFGDPALILRKEAASTATPEVAPSVYAPVESIAPLYTFSLTQDITRSLHSSFFETKAGWESLQEVKTEGEEEAVTRGKTTAGKLATVVERIIASGEEIEALPEEEYQTVGKIVRLGPVAKYRSRTLQKKLSQAKARRAREVRTRAGQGAPSWQMSFWERVREMFARVVDFFKGMGNR
jgi:hypothetical protein